MDLEFYANTELPAASRPTILKSQSKDGILPASTMVFGPASAVWSRPATMSMVGTFFCQKLFKQHRSVSDGL